MDFLYEQLVRRKRVVPKRYSRSTVMWVVESADPCRAVEEVDNFWAVSTDIHLYSKALLIVEKSDYLVEGYANAVVSRFGESIPYSIEYAIIKRPGSRLIVAFSKAGVKWSEKAQELMKKEAPLAYERNIVAKGS